MLSPFEQLLYITPFDKKLSYASMFNNYSNQSEIKEIITNLFKDFKQLYPDIDSIAQKVFSSKQNDDIDCRGAHYLNKCILSVINDSNMINELNVKNTIRKYLSIDSQNNEISSHIDQSKKNGYLKEYNKYKKLFKLTGKIKYKEKYRYYRYILQ